MNTALKHELPEMLRDQFDSVFGRMQAPNRSHDALIAGTQAAGLASFKPELSLEQCYAMARRLAASLLMHKRANEDSANLEEAEDFACGIVLNLGAEIRNLERYQAHEFKCPCDSCAAARSDEAYDRKIDRSL